MTPDRFSRYCLFTPHLAGAVDFYRASCALDCVADAAWLGVEPLHEKARAKRVPSHWLGVIDVGDVGRACRLLVESGGALLGPSVPGPDGRPPPHARSRGGPSPLCECVRVVDGALRIHRPFGACSILVWPAAARRARPRWHGSRTGAVRRRAVARRVRRPMGRGLCGGVTTGWASLTKEMAAGDRNRTDRASPLSGPLQF